MVNFLYLSVFISFYCELLRVNWIQVEFKWNKIINSLNQKFKWQACRREQLGSNYMLHIMLSSFKSPSCYSSVLTIYCHFEVSFIQPSTLPFFHILFFLKRSNMKIQYRVKYPIYIFELTFYSMYPVSFPEGTLS